MQALPIFLDRLVDPVTAVVLSVTVVLFFGELSNHLFCNFALAILRASPALISQEKLSLKLFARTTGLR